MTTLLGLTPPPEVLLYLLNLLLQITLATLLGWLIVTLLRRKSAPLRYEVRLSVLLFILIAPLTTWAAGRYLIPDNSPTRIPLVPSLVTFAPPPTPTVQPAVPKPAGAPAEKASHPIRWKPIALLLGLVAWASGSLYFLARLIRGLFLVRQIRRSCRPTDDPRFQETAATVSKKLGLHRPPSVYRSPRVRAPLTLGLLRPSVVLPAALDGPMTNQAIEGMLLHELAHISRRDLWVGLTHNIVGLLYWWHPLIHALERELIRLREEICDNYVMQEQRGGATFARCLTDISEQSTGPTQVQTAAGLLQPASSFRQRITRLLRKEQDMKTQLTPWAARTTAFLTLLGWCAVIPLALVMGSPGADVHAAPILVAPGYTIEPFVTGLDIPAALEISPGGAYGTGMFVTEQGPKRILRVDLSSGAFSEFAPPGQFTGYP